MKLKTNKLIVFVLGIYFFSLGILAIINTLISKNYFGILWICYFGLLFVGIGMLMRNSSFILSQLNLLIIPLIFWNIDFFYRLITGNPFFGITDYLFVGQKTLGNFITLQHIYIIPFALYAIYLIKLKRTDAWKISFLEISLIFLLSLLFSPAEKNVNCIFNSCVSFVNVSGIWYHLFWIFLVFIMILITNFLIVFIFKKKPKEFSKK
ncbi:MAG: hypothetical protein ABFQ65_04755 [Nanoarchaeota archaeon]